MLRRPPGSTRTDPLLPYTTLFRSLRSGRRVLAKVGRDTATLVFEYRDELEASTERFEVLAQRRHADILGVLELGDRPLGHVETTGQLGLAHGLGVAQLVEPDLLEGLGTLGRQTFSRARAPLDVGAELGELEIGRA